MAEVAVAHLNDEVSANALVSRLAVDGIRARVDRGLAAAYLTNTSNQVRVMVDERDAGKARAIADAGRSRR